MAALSVAALAKLRSPPSMIACPPGSRSPLLPAEGVASSRFEETRAPAIEIAAADASSAVGGSAAWTAGNLSATFYRKQGPDPCSAGSPAPTNCRSIETILAAILGLAANWPNRLRNVRADAAANMLLPQPTTHPAREWFSAAGPRQSHRAGSSCRAQRVDGLRHPPHHPSSANLAA